MSVTVLDSATLDAVALATTQPEQLDAIEAAFAGDITVRAMAGSTVAEVCTYGTWVRDSAEPRGMTLGALSACTVNVTDATITSFVFVEGGAPIFSIPAADASLDSPTTKTGRRTSLADAVLTKHRIIADASLPLGTATTYLLTFALADTATVDVAVSGSITNTGTGACTWSITPPAHVSVTPSSGTLAAGGTQSLSVEIDTAGTYDLTLVSVGATITGAAQNVVASLAPATILTLSVPSTGTAGVAVTVTATPNGPVAGGGTATLSTTAGTLGSTTLTWADGESAAKTSTLTLASAGSADVSLTTGLSLSISGSPTSFTATVLNARIAIWGQSNAIGRADRTDIAAAPLSSDSGLTTYDAGTFSRVYIWTGAAYAQLQPSVNNQSDAGQFGAEFGLAVRWMRETASGNLYIEKKGYSGVSIDYFDPTAAVYLGIESARASANAWLSSAGVTIGKEAALWVQGETDMFQTQGWYASRLATLLDARVTDGFQAASDMTVLAQMKVGSAGYGAGVAAAKDAYAAADTTLASTVSMDYYKADNLHPNGQGQVQLGYDAYEVIFSASHIST